MSPNRVPRRKSGKSEKREREKHGSCRSCVFTYRKRRPPKEEAARDGEAGGTEKKRTLVASKGSRCEECGYDRCLAALTFHHRDRAGKSFTISASLGLPIDVLEQEAEKCSLLCLNCHAELHHGLNGFGGHGQGTREEGVAPVAQ